MSKHTKEPWTIDHIYDHEGCGCCSQSFCDEDRGRILSCVNALAGINDPYAWVQNAKKLIEMDIVRNPLRYDKNQEES